MTDHVLSFSQWRSICACPAAWHAEKIRGVYHPEVTEAMQLGTLLDWALLTPDAQRPGVNLLLTKKGWNAEATRTLACAEWARALLDVRALFDGCQFQVPFTCELGGIAWRGIADIVDPGGAVVDLKRAGKGVYAEEWSARFRRHVTWHEAGLYWYQTALYGYGLFGDAPCDLAILAVQPGDPVHDLLVIELGSDEDDYRQGLLRTMEASVNASWSSPITGQQIPPIVEMLNDITGATIPRCETCAYCKSSRPSRFTVWRPIRSAL